MPNKQVPIEILPGVEPSTDKPTASTRHYTFTDKIRFVDGLPEKVGGWESLSYDQGDSISGAARSLFSYILSGLNRYMIGTNTRLYDLTASASTNITPVQVATTVIANSLDTYYTTLGNDPVATTNTSTTLVVTDTAHKFEVNDTVTLSGATATNGVPAGEINTDHLVRAVDTNTFSIIVSTAATSAGSGGGASVVRSSGIITVNATAHGMADGDRAEIAAAAATGGITAVQINLQHIIRDVGTNVFDIVTAGTATSSVSGGGGASTTYQTPIDAGEVDAVTASGFGAGLYGVGLYGVSKTSSTISPPRIWSHDRFGDLIVSTPGDGTGLYSWDGVTTTAPALVSNAPTTVNYTFVTNNICVVLGYDTGAAAANVNGISWSAQGGLTNWTTAESGSDTIEGANEFITHASARGENLLFTANQTYIFRFIGGQFIFKTTQLDPGIGIIGQNARCVAEGTVYWVGFNNFYRYRGGNVEVVPSNSSTSSTILRYVFDNLNESQQSKTFMWYNPAFREIWIHYPSASSDEPDRIGRYNIDEGHWTPDTLDRTAAEYPSIVTQNPYLIDENGVTYIHENGRDDDGSGMSWQITSNLIYGGSNTVQHKAFIPDYNLSGNMTVGLTTQDYPRSSNKTSKSYTVTTTSTRVATEQNGRYWQYDLTGSAVDQQMEVGNWIDELKQSSPK
jgi:hypothetical protein